MVVLRWAERLRVLGMQLRQLRSSMPCYFIDARAESHAVLLKLVSMSSLNMLRSAEWKEC